MDGIVIGLAAFNLYGPLAYAVCTEEGLPQNNMQLRIALCISYKTWDAVFVNLNGPKDA